MCGWMYKKCTRNPLGCLPTAGVGSRSPGGVLEDHGVLCVLGVASVVDHRLESSRLGRTTKSFARFCIVFLGEGGSWIGIERGRRQHLIDSQIVNKHACYGKM